MKNILSRLWADEAGFVVSSELILIATIIVIGLITGLTTVRDQVNTELADVADAISEINQSYSYGAIVAHCSSTAGSVFTDRNDFCDTDPQGVQGVTGFGTCLVVCATGATPEAP